VQSHLTPQQKTYESSLTNDETLRAIYIDFEGFTNQPPTLVGYYLDQYFIQVVFDSALTSAALAKELAVHDGKTTVANLLSLATERRRIVTV
jgi:hypothetical protein